MTPLRGLPLIVVMIIDYYETLWGRPVTSDEVAFAIAPVATVAAVEAACRALAANDQVCAVHDGWHCTAPLRGH